MGFLGFARGALTHAGCFAVSVTKYTGRFKCVTSLPASGFRVNRYSQGSADRRDVTGQFVCYQLPHRTILKIRGQDTSPFLQGIITNDMDLLEEPAQRVMYSHMLNVQGRTLFDIMLYRYAAFTSSVMCIRVCFLVNTRAWPFIF